MMSIISDFPIFPGLFTGHDPSGRRMFKMSRVGSGRVESEKKWLLIESPGVGSGRVKSFFHLTGRVTGRVKKR